MDATRGSQGTSGNLPGAGGSAGGRRPVWKGGDGRNGATFGACDGNQDCAIYKLKDGGLKPRKRRICHTPELEGTGQRGRFSLPVPVPFSGASATGPRGRVQPCLHRHRRWGGGFLPAVTDAPRPLGPGC